MVQALAAGQVVKAQLWTTDGEQAAVSTWHYHVEAVVPVAPDLQDFLTSWLAAVATAYKALLCASAHLDGGQAQIVFPLPLMNALTSPNGAGNGVVAEPALARQTAGLLNYKTAFAGPGGRGRTYIPFPGAPDTIGNGRPSDDYVTRLNTLALALGSFVTVTGAAGTATVQVGLKGATAGDFRPFTSSHGSDKWATQKRRGSYGRPNVTPVPPP